MNSRSRWFETRLHAPGMLAFMMHRLSGLGLVFYLYLHLTLLDALRSGPSGWGAFLSILRSPLVLILDAVLLFGLVFHGLNGLRLTLIGANLFVDRQRSLFWLSLALAATVTVAGAALMR